MLSLYYRDSQPLSSSKNLANIQPDSSIALQLVISSHSVCQLSIYQPVIYFTASSSEHIIFQVKAAEIHLTTDLSVGHWSKIGISCT